MLIRRFFAFVVSLFILFSLPLNAANAASSWSITNAVSAGSRTVVSATSGGYKAAVNIAPTAGRLALKLGKGANWAALLYAAIQLAPDLADIDSFQPDYSKQAVNYRLKASNYWAVSLNSGVKRYSDPADGCSDFEQLPRYNFVVAEVRFVNPTTVACYLVSTKEQYKEGKPFINQTLYLYKDTSSTQYKSIPISSIAPQVIKNANSGHAPSQAATRETAVEMVITGDFDADLLSGAVPTSDTKPLIPAVPGNRNGNVTHGSDVGTGQDGMSGATPGQQADAAKDAADASKKAAEAAADAAKAAAEDARKAADDAKDLINSGADQAAIDAADARAKAAEKAAADSKAAADAAIGAANDRAAAAERAAAAATAAAQAAADKAAADAAAAQAAAAAAAAADKAAAQAAADKAAAAAAQAARDLAAAKEKQAAAEKAAEKAKAEAAKPFELPPFCSWAAPVCDFIDWFKEPPPADLPAGDVPFATTGDVGLDSVDRFEKRIEFSGQCPANDFSFTMMGVTYAKPIPYHHLCGFLEQIAPWLLAMCYLGVAYFVVENI